MALVLGVGSLAAQQERMHQMMGSREGMMRTMEDSASARSVFALTSGAARGRTSAQVQGPTAHLRTGSRSGLPLTTSVPRRISGPTIHRQRHTAEGQCAT